MQSSMPEIKMEVKLSQASEEPSTGENNMLTDADHQHIVQSSNMIGNSLFALDQCVKRFQSSGMEDKKAD